MKLDALDERQKRALNMMQSRDKYAWFMYTGDYVFPDNIDFFLHKKALRESDRVYSERALWADPSMYFSTVVDEIAGMLFGNESEANRQWVKDNTRNDLGDPMDNNSPSYRIIHNADGQETDWTVLFRKLAVAMIALKHVWVYVDGVKEEDGTKAGEASVNIIYPWDVVDTMQDKYGKFVEVVVKREVDKRTTVKQKPDKKDEYLLFDLFGVSVFADADLKTQIGDTIEYAYYANAQQQESDRILPIFKADLSLDREVGYLLARKANVLFNFESVRDYAYRDVAFNFLELTASDETFGKMISNLIEGTNVLQRDPQASAGASFLQLSADVVSVGNTTLLEKVKQFYQSAFREYADSAKTSTATEIVQKSNSSINAFLTILSMSMDEAENQTMYRLTQVYNPDNPSVWGDTYVSRSTDFVPINIETVIDSLMKRYVGDMIPLSDEPLKQVLGMISKYDNYELSEDDLNKIVEMIRTKQGNKTKPSEIPQNVPIPQPPPVTPNEPPAEE